MSLFRRRSWGLAARLMAIALVPAFLMLIAVNLWLYVAAKNEVDVDIRERGRLLAASLSEGSQYGVISGNVAAVDRTVRALMAADSSIASIQVLDSRREPIVTVGTPVGRGDAQAFEVPIATAELDVNLFDTTRTPHITIEQPTTTIDPAAAAAGYVRVVMSPVPLQDAKRKRLFAGSAVVLLAALGSAAVGLILARRMRRPLDSVMSALRRIRQGDYAVQLDTRTPGELGELQSAIVEMARGLDLTHQDLEDQVAVRTRQLQDAIEAVRAADADKRRLIVQFNERVEEERRRLSLEIHDDLNAALVSVRLQAGALAADPESPPEVREAAERIAAVTDEVYSRARRIVKQLRPEIIDTLGLPGAIEEMVRHFDEIHPQCRFVFTAAPDLPALSDQPAIAAYRVVQEALSNVVKHAEASRCEVRMERLEGDGGIRLTIGDNGKGFATADAAPVGIGIIGMRERIFAIGGSMDIDSAPGRGTTVSIVLPHPS
jgi:two-component system sensor histidine kinase UhpB